MNKRMLGNYGNTNFHMLQKIHNNIGKIANKTDLEKVFTIEWKDTTFNVVPFLCAGFSYFTDDTKQVEIAVASIARFMHNNNMIDTDLQIGLYQVFKNLLPTREFEIFNCLPIHPSPQRAAMSIFLYYMYIRDKKNFLSLMLEIQSGLLSELVLDERQFAYWTELGDRSLGNTEAFCFYIGLYWLLKVEPQYRVLLGKFLSHLDLKSKYREFCPENCFLDKVLTGQIEDNKILEEYRATRFLDDSSYFYRSLMQSTSDGQYDGHDLSKEVREIFDYFDYDEKNYLYGEAMLRSFNSTDGIKTQSDIVNKLKETIDKQERELEKNQKSISKQNKRLDEYREEVQALNSELNNMKGLIKEQTTDEELKEQIVKLNEEIKQLKIENADFERVHLRDKQEISMLRKRVGKIGAKDIETQLDIYEDDELSVPNDIPIENKVKVIGDKKIILVGAEFLTTTVQKLNELGLNNVELCSKDTKKPGKFDVCVVLATRCMHDVVRRMETFADKYDALWLYSTSVNAEKIIDLIYDYSIEESEQIDCEKK